LEQNDETTNVLTSQALNLIVNFHKTLRKIKLAKAPSENSTKISSTAGNTLFPDAAKIFPALPEKLPHLTFKFAVMFLGKLRQKRRLYVRLSRLKSAN